MSLSLDSVKQLILRCYRKLDPRELDGLKKTAGGGYVTADNKWVYLIRHGGYIEREPAMMILNVDGSKEVFPLTTQWPVSGYFTKP